LLSLSPAGNSIVSKVRRDQSLPGSRSIKVLVIGAGVIGSFNAARLT